MSLKTKVPLIARSLVAAMALVGAAHAANPLEQIASQQSDKLQQRNNDHGSRNDEREHKADREHRHGHQDDKNNSNASCRDERNLRSVQGNVHTTVKFVNRTHQEVRTYWLDYNGKRVFYKAIPPNGNYTQPTFQTHPWVITDSRDNCLDIYVSNQPSATVDIR